MKIILLTLLCISGLFSSNISFKESRYLAALDFERAKYGILEIKDQILIVNYTKPSIETITYLEDKLTIFKNDSLREYNFEEHPQAQYMGLILKAILTDEYEALDELFKIKNKKDIIILSAKPIMYSTMEEIEVLKKDNIINKIIIYMTNKDKITIETIN